MAIRYHHTQRGTLMLVVLPAAAVVAALAAALNPSPPGRLVGLAIALGSGVLAWLFSSLTADVNERELRWHFGPGVWQYRVGLNEIDTVQVVRNRWWYGYGIRWRAGFRLYNVSGLDAVELRLKSGDVRRIGTDDAHGLAGALRS